MGIKVNKNKRKVEIKLNPDFYDLSTIKETSKEFAGICPAKIKKTKECIEIVLTAKSDELLDTVGHEFCNYVLGLMKNKTIV